MPTHSSTIVALATPPGKSAIAVIRLSGPDAILLVDRVLKGKDLSCQPAHTIHFGTLYDGKRLIDEVLVSIFRAPHSFTKEDSVEISCHGSPFIVQEIITLLLRHGAQPAEPGEFTKRAFLAGRFDLSGAEAVADLIGAETSAAHQAALHHMRGGFARELKALRTKLMHCASLLELSLDFAEEDVTFASKEELTEMISGLLDAINTLITSFSLGNVIKHGVATVIAGKPNAGKSTLLNALLGEEKALVSDVAGTTRDIIEDCVVWGGIAFRFMDTAGLRRSKDKIEAMGIARAYEKMKSAHLILHVFDLGEESATAIKKKVNEVKKHPTPYLLIGNKMDKASDELQKECVGLDVFLIAARDKKNIEELKAAILQKVITGEGQEERTIVVNARHYHSLCKTKEVLEEVLKGLKNNLSPELLVLDIRHALHYLGSITGEITTDDLLTNIFSKFCIGK